MGSVLGAQAPPGCHQHRTSLRQMEIKSTATCYRVMVNGRHAFDYNYRIPDNQVDQMEVDGDVGLSYVQY